ncbi:helix-turn-helix domain-containing protein [Virgibacillus flavescens]|uniref:helix-turn-helix domain-containing protein n=1 Tax=Virgibacillus flavescens TaxID=1611422 RepID=UPI003D33A3F6
MIGDNIKGLRKQKGLTLSELATRAKISKSYLSNIERSRNKNPSIHIIEKLAAVLDVDIWTLLEPDSKHNKLPESEWLDFVKELQESGVESEHLKEFKSVIEFAKWQNKRLEDKKR